MKLNIPTKYVILAILSVFTVLFGVGWYVGYKIMKNRLQATETLLNQEILNQRIEIDKKTLYLSRTVQELTTEKKLRKELEITNRDLKKINISQANEITQLKLRVDTLLEGITHTGEVIVIHDTVAVRDVNCIVLPFEFEKNDEWLRLKGKFDSQGGLDVDLGMDVSIDVLTGLDENKQPSCVLKTGNPYIETLSINSYKTDTPKKKKFGVGLQAGYGLTLDKSPHFAPYIGLGLSVNLIRF